MARVDQLTQRLAVAGERAAADRARRLAALAAALRAPDRALRDARVAGAGRALATALRARLDVAASGLAHAAAALELVSPNAVLARGYAIVTGPGGGIVRDASTLGTGDAVSVALSRGDFGARVESVRPAGLAEHAPTRKPDSDAGTD